MPDAPTHHPVVRELGRDELEKIWLIDRGEVHHHVYRVIDGRLLLEQKFMDIPGWDPDQIDADTPILRQIHDRGGSLIGTFFKDDLGAVAVVGNEPVCGSADVVQLKYLYVDRGLRGKGLGGHLFAAALSAARALGARKLYISATPTRNTVDFYLAQGCRLATPPDPLLYRQEPHDIHLIRTTGDGQLLGSACPS